MDKHQLTAQTRDLQQKPAALRRAGLLPANIYGVGDSQAITLPVKDTLKLMAQISESTVFYLTLGNKEVPVMLSEVQRHPITGQIIHLSLRQVNLKQKVTAMIPVETVGNFNVPGAFFHVVTDEIEAEALPTDLPEKFVVDVSNFKAIGDEVTFADLDYDHSKVTLKIEDEKLPVVMVNEVVEQAEEEETTAAQTDATATEATQTATSADAQPQAA